MNRSGLVRVSCIVALLLVAGCGKEVQTVRPVDENSVPSVRITASALSGTVPLEVAFQSAVTGGDGALSYAWEFGDGSEASTLESPTHLFESAGSFAIRLTVEDADGDTARDLLTVVVGGDQTPSVYLSSSARSGLGPLSVQFLALAAGGNAPLTYAWDFGDGMTAEGSPSIVHLYDAPGQYVATVTVTDADGDAVEATLDVSVLTDSVPTVTALASVQSGQVPLAVAFECAAEDGDGAVTYGWSFGNGQESGLRAPTFTFVTPGVFTATCTATDVDGDRASASVEITVTPDTTPTVILSGTPAAGLAPLDTAFTALVAGGEAPVTLDWSFGDGETLADGGVSTTHIFASPGAFLVAVKATDADGDEALATFQVIAGTNEVPLVALFARPAEGLAPLAVDLEARAVGGNPPLTFAWDFGDGATATGLPMQRHVYAAGTHVATVAVMDANGDTAEATLEVVVAEDTSPLATATATATQGQAPLAVAFTCSTAGGNPPFTYEWSFGDGGRSTLSSPAHTYQSAGSYAATCVITDSDGDVDLDTLTIVVAPDTQPSVVLRGSPASGLAPITVAFEASVAGGEAPLTYAWDFGDGAGSTSAVQNPTHTYLAAGTYVAVLRVTDADGDETLSSFTVVAGQNETPTVSLTASATQGIEPLTVRFQANTAGGNGPLTYSWDVGAGGAAGTAHYEHTFAAGAHQVQVLVTDADGDVASSVVSVIVEADVAAEATVNLSPASGQVPLSPTFRCLAGGNWPVSFHWDFGDGQTSSEEFPSHTYTVPGTYSVLCTVRDADGDLATFGLPVTATPDTAPELILSAGPTSGVVPFAVTFDARVSGGEAPLFYQWNFGDGTTSWEMQPVHTYAVAGSYLVSLSVTDADGDTAIATLPIVAASDEVPVVLVSASPTSGEAPLAVHLRAQAGGGNQPLTYSWALGDGVTLSGVDQLEHVYGAGTYAINVTVTDADGDQASDTTVVQVSPPDLAPVPMATLPLGACAVPGTTMILLDASGSVDPEGAALSYEWELFSVPPGSMARLNNDRVVAPTLWPDLPGTYEARVWVSDGRHRVASDPVLVVASDTAAGVVLLGNLQTGPVDSILPVALGLELTNECGSLLPDVEVHWTAQGASALDPVTYTDGTGRASTLVKLGTVAGPVAVLAHFQGQTAAFDLSAEPGPAEALYMDRVEPAPVSTTTGAILNWRITDAFGNPVTPLSEVTFSVWAEQGWFKNRAPGETIQLTTSGGMASAELISRVAGQIRVSPFDLSAPLQPLATSERSLGDFEDWGPDWWRNGPWETGVPMSGPGAAHSGQHVLATNLMGDFSVPPGPFWEVTAGRWIDLPPGTAAATVSMWHWYALPDGDCSVSALLVSQDGTFLSPQAGWPTGQRCFTGSSGGWVQSRFGVSPQPGFFSLLLRGTDSAQAGPGWYVDDVRLEYVSPESSVTFLPGPAVGTVSWVAAQGTTMRPAEVLVWVLDAFGNVVNQAGHAVSVSVDGQAELWGLTRGTDWVATTSQAGMGLTNNEGVLGVWVGDVVEETVTFTANLGGSGPSSAPVTFSNFEAQCLDGMDDDGDGLMDCEDSDCRSRAECQMWYAIGEQCDGLDAPTNGLIDDAACACVTDQGCDQIDPAVPYLCHFNAGVCAPDCNMMGGDGYCTNLGFPCQPDGRCGW